MKVFTTLLVLVAATAVAVAQQFGLQASSGFGPFVQGVTVNNTFTVSNIPTGVTVTKVRFQLRQNTGTGGTFRTLADQLDTLKSITLNMGTLPFGPDPYLVVTSNYIDVDGSQRVDSRLQTLDIRPPNVNLASSAGWGPVVVGQRFTSSFTVTNLPPQTSRVEMTVRRGSTVVTSKVTTGVNLTTADVALDEAIHQPGLSVTADISYPAQAPQTYQVQRVITDSLPVPTITASAGMGPFIEGVPATNRFIVRGAGPACTNIRYYVASPIPYVGGTTVLYDITIPYSASGDSAAFTLDMGTIFSTATLTVSAIYGPGTGTRRDVQVPLVIRPNTRGPHWTPSANGPFVLGQSLDYTLRIDTLPARTNRLRLSVRSQVGETLKDTVLFSQNGLFLSTGQIRFNTRILPEFTSVVVAECFNDVNADAIEFPFFIDVRDTTKPYLFASSWGPFIEGDSDVVAFSASDIRATLQSGDSLLVSFDVTDSAQSQPAVAASVPQNVTNISRSDTTFWIGRSGNRDLVSTANFPVDAWVNLRLWAKRGNDTVALSSSRHPIWIQPFPGRLSSNGGFGPFIAGRDSLVTFTVDSLPDDATSVTFSVTGRTNPAAIDSVRVTDLTTGSATFTTNVGRLPLNARLLVSVVRTSSIDGALKIQRPLRIVNDTLTATATLGWGPYTLGWNTMNNRVLAPRPQTNSITISRLPAQTLSVSVSTIDDRGVIIDSVSMNAAYRLRFDPTSSVTMNIPIRAINSSIYRVRILTDGGPPEGITYSLPIQIIPPPMMVAVSRLDTLGDVLPGAFRTGMKEVADMKISFTVDAQGQAIQGVDASRRIDSVVFRARDCSWRIVDTVAVHPDNPVSQALFGEARQLITKWPLNTEYVEATVYARSLTYPDSGRTFRTPVAMIPAPIISNRYGHLHPTFRVSDSITRVMLDRYTITNLPIIEGLVRISAVNKNGDTVKQYVPLNVNDGRVFIDIDVNDRVYSPTNSPYVIKVLAEFRQCDTVKSFPFTLDTLTIRRALIDSVRNNWVYCSTGWGPHQQGKSARSTFTMRFDPAQFLPNTTDSHHVRVQYRLVNANPFVIGNIFRDTTIVYRKNGTLPVFERVGMLMPEEIGGGAPGLVFRAQVTTSRITEAGEQILGTDTLDYPITMLPFPPQPLVSDKGWGPHEQSVVAGAGTPYVMVKNLAITDSVASTIMRRIPLRWLDHLSVAMRQDTMIKRTTPIIQDDTVYLWDVRNVDVAQFPWPNIQPDFPNATMEIGYWFEGPWPGPTAYQRQTILLRPRARWLNGNSFSDWSQNGATVSLTAHTPLPTAKFAQNMPLLDTLPLTIGREGGNFTFDTEVRYDTASKQFSFVDPEPDEGPEVSAAITVTWFNMGREAQVRDGETKDGYTSLYRFESEVSLKDTLQNRNMRVRNKVNGSLSYNILGPVFFIAKMVELAAGGEVEPIGVVPKFSFALGGQSIYTMNAGVGDGSQFQYLGAPPSSSTTITDAVKNNFPTSIGNAFTMTAGIGAELEVAGGLAGVGMMFDNQVLVGSGNTYSGAVQQSVEQTYHEAGAYRLYLSLEATAFWGLIKIELWKGLLYSVYDPRFMPSFRVFEELEGGLLAGVNGRKRGLFEGPQAEEGLFRRPLPPEGPFYYAKPTISGNDSAIVAAWVEHSLRSRSGILRIGRVTASEHRFVDASIVVANDQGIHDPAVAVLSERGDALVAWAQNERSAGTISATDNLTILTQTENVEAAVVHANGAIDRLSIADPEGRADGRPSITANSAGTRAALVWSARHGNDTTTDVVATTIDKVGNQWIAAEPVRLVRDGGHDRSIQVVTTDTSSFEALWIAESNGRANRLLHSRFTSGSWSAPSDAVAIASTSTIRDVEAATSNGQGILVLVADNAIGNEVVDYYTLRNSQWVKLGTFDVGSDVTVTHVEAAVHPTGKATVIAHLDRLVNDGERRSTVTFTTDDVQSTAWTRIVDDEDVANTTHDVWSHSVSYGPGGDIYMVTQELDTIPGNRQQYANGVAIGSSRVNSVLRGLRLVGDEIEAKPIDGSPTTNVEEDAAELRERFATFVGDVYPSPSSTTAAIPFVLQRNVDVTVSIVDLMGQVVKTVHNGPMSFGQFDLGFDVSSLPSGAYNVVIITSDGERLSAPLRILR